MSERTPARQNAYLEVLSTYSQRIRSSIVVTVLIAAGAVMVVTSIIAPSSRSNTAPWHFMIFGDVTWMFLLWVHFVQQMLSPGRRFIPGYVLRHVVIFLMLAAIIGVAWPLALRGIAEPVAAIAGATLLFAYMGWWTVTRSRLLTCAGFGSYFWLIFGSYPTPVADLFSGRHPAAAIALLAGGLIASAVIIRRTINLMEDDRDFGQAMQTSDLNSRPRMTGDTSRAWSIAAQQNFLPWLNTQTAAYLPRHDTQWERVRRWRSLQPGAFNFAVIMTIFMVGMTSIPYWFSSTKAGPYFVMPIIFLTMMPITGVGQAWLKQWRFLETDSLKPIDRSAFLNELGLAIALDALRTWVVWATAIILGSLFFGLVDWSLLASVMAASFFFQFFLLGVSIWEMRHRSEPVMLMTNGASMLVILLITPLVALPPNMQVWMGYRWILVAIAAISAGAGVLIARHAYQRWLTTEFG